MKKMKNTALLRLLILLALAMLVLAGCGKITEVPTDDTYSYTNPEVLKAEPDAGMIIDGVLDEEEYQNNNWLYLHNDDAGNDVNIAMTSYYGEKGMYIVYDVTESVPIYVNPERSPVLNSCIEMYLAPPYLATVQDNSIFEIDLMPTGDMSFRKSNGAYGYTDVITTNEGMAVLGATTKGGEVNTPECYGYCLELFIPWDYLKWLDMDTDAMRNGYVYINPAHITSNNFDGTNVNLDRYWYYYAQQQGADFSNVFQYFRFNGDGVMGTAPVTAKAGDHYTISGQKSIMPGMLSNITLTPEDGYALTSILANGEEQIENVSYNEDGSVTLKVRAPEDGITVSAKAEPVTEGKKTLSGKITINSMAGGDLKDVLAYYVGPTGERPLEFDSEGNFEHKDLEQGYYMIKVEKEGYTTINRGIYLNQDVYTELTLEYEMLRAIYGTCWILDEQNDGILRKFGGSGQIMSQQAYNNFTFSANLKYDEALAKQGDNDYFTQQRSGMRIMFSNGKYWHINLMKEKDRYIVQYGRHTGEASVFNWKTIHTLSSSEAALYKSEEGIRLRVMRQGQFAAIWLGNKLLAVEKLPGEYASCTANVGMEAWIANRTVMEIPYSISAGVPVNVAGSPFHWPAEIWDISNQYNGKIIKYPAPGKDTWLDSQIIANDVTTIAKDQSPETNDYSMVYIFKFSNNESFRVRLNHTDSDGKYRIQSFAGSTLFAAWKNHYTLTDEEAQKAMTDGIEYRVQILGTTAYVFLEGKQVCTYDLSTNINTGKPSGIENATSKVSFRLDGNLNGNTVIPFKLENNSKNVTVNIAETENGTITAEKTNYKVGDTVKLIVTGAEGYYYSNLSVDGIPVKLDWDGTYSFTAEKNIYEIAGSFDLGVFAENSESAWNLINQNRGQLMMESHESGNSGFVSAIGVTNDVYTDVKDLAPDAKDFSMIYYFTFSNGEKFNVRLNHTDDDGKYRIQTMSGSTVFAPWKNGYTLSNAEAAKVQGDGIRFQVTIKGTTAHVKLDGTEVCTFDLSKVIATGDPSGIESADASVAIRMDGNLNQDVVVPFQATDASVAVELVIESLENGKVVADQTSYKVGDTITLTVVPNDGYSQKIYINEEPLMLDWKTNTYSFVAEKNLYVVSGSFEPSIQFAPSDANRWDSGNQAHGVLTTYYPKDNDSWWMDIKGEYQSVTVKAKNYKAVEDSKDGNGNVGFATILRVTMDNGKVYAFRVINDKGTYAYDRYGSGGSLTGWGGWKSLNSLASQFNGEGVDFKLARTGDDILTLSVNGAVMENYTMAGVTADNKIASISIQHNGNKGEVVEVPFKLAKPGDAPEVQINIAEMTNGTVTTEKATYCVGDLVVLNVTPDAGYSQKLYINDEPLMLDWKTNQYSFEATEETYNITGSFEPSFKDAPSDANRWDSSNQAHGVITTYYPSNNDSWWYKIEGEYKSIAVTAKNYLPQADSAEGSGTSGYSFVLAATLDNGKTYAFRILNEKEGGTGSARYIYTRFGAGGAVTGWSGWCLPETKAPGVTAKLQGDGAEFKLTRTGADKLQITLDGVVLDTYTMEGVTDANKVTSVGIHHYGNKGQKVEIPFVLATPTDGEELKLNIAEMTNGTVTPGQASYKVGDTVTLVVAPDAGYSQKLYIDGKPILLDWKTNKYTFVAEKDTYNITGSFEPGLKVTPSDEGRWDSSNQAHGVLTAYYPANNDAWWNKIEGEYKSIAVTAKNYLPQADSAEGSGTIGYSMVLGVTMDNGKFYAFRILNEKDGGSGNARYIYTRYGAGGSVTAWGGWCMLETKVPGVTEKLQGDGAEFKLTRTGANTLQITLDGVVLDTYTMEGVTEANKVVSVSLHHYGNKGQKVQIPFCLANSTDPDAVKVNIATMTGGTVTADKDSYKVGDTVTLTVAPDAGNSQKIFINDEPVLLDWKTNQYSFVAEKDTYNITGSFEPSLKVTPSDANRWDSSNQAHGVIATYYPSNNDSWWYTFDGEYKSITVKAKNYKAVADSQDGNGKVGFATILRVTMDNGNAYAFRVINDKGTYAFDRYGGNGLTGWGGWKNLSSLASQFNGDGVDFELARTGDNVLTLSVNGTVMETYTMAGITADNKVVSVSVQHNGNKGEKVEIPFTLVKPGDAANVQINIADLTGGTVTADKESYKIGDTVTLTITPDAGNSQKIFLNDEPVLLDWKTNKYSFKATEEVYNVTGSFEKSLSTAPSDANRFDTANEAHGVLNAYYPANNDSWWMDIKGDYKSISVKAKNYWAVDDSYEGIANGGGFRIVLRATMDNGKNYAFSVWIDTQKRYAYNHFGGGSSATGWSGAWCAIADKNAAAVADFNADGAEFKLERIDGNHFQITLNGTVLETYTIPDVTASNKVVSVGVAHYGNKGVNVAIPFTLTK